jgi:hypothetical protein
VCVGALVGLWPVTLTKAASIRQETKIKREFILLIENNLS